VGLARSIQAVVASTRTLEGGGFPVRRPFPTHKLPLVDPFLLLDEMGPMDWGPGEAIGAPPHPHRGFETVTYVLQGRMVHKDSHGHTAALGPGDVQWMTAGAGVVHSEMPEREFKKGGGIMHGFQIWVNLPRAKKMMPARYQDIPATSSPVAFNADQSVRVRVIAGESLGALAALKTEIPMVFLHVTLEPGAEFNQPLSRDKNAFAYLISGDASFGAAGQTSAKEGDLVLFEQDGDEVIIRGGAQGVDLLLLAAVPLNEPVARYGPFVMNTQEELQQAFEDYRAGKMGTVSIG
jgi:redox-sensitive bicupin YhaK (pirin superfamily)